MQGVRSLLLTERFFSPMFWKSGQGRMAFMDFAYGGIKIEMYVRKEMVRRRLRYVQGVRSILLTERFFS